MKVFATAGVWWLGMVPLILCTLANGARAQQAGVAARQYAAATDLQSRGEYRLAAEAWQKFIAGNKSDERIGRAYHNLGVCLYQEGKYQQALAVFEKAATDYPQSDMAPATQLHLGATQFALARAGQREMYDRAAKTLLALVTKHAQGDHVPEACYYLGESLYAQGKRQEAVAWYARLLEKHPTHKLAPQALYMTGLASLEVGQFSAALAYATKFQAAYADHALAPDVLHVAAESNLQLAKLAEAETLYRQLVEKYPNHPDAELWKVRRAATLHAQKKYDETLRALEPLLAELRMPDSVAEAQYLIGTSRLELKQPGEAVKALAASLEAQPKWRQAFETCLALAEADRQAGDLDDAQAAVHRAIAEFPQSRLLDRATYRLGTYLALAGRADAAAEAYRRVVTEWPQSPLAPYALHELGCAQLNLKDAAGADATFSKLLEKHAKHALALRARYARAMARQQQGRPAEAIADLEAVLAAGPAAKDRSDARFLLGLCQVELKQYDKAAATFRLLFSEDPKRAGGEEALHQWAWALKLAGREAEAAKVFARLAADYPKSPLASEALFNVADGHFKGKDYASAAEAYYAVMGKAVGTPLAEKAALQLAWCYYRQGNFADAQKTFAYYVENYPNGAMAGEAAFMGAECLFQQGLAAEALAAYAKLKPSPNRQTQAAILLHAGRAAGQLERWSESIEWLDRFERECPDSPTLPDALCELGFARQNLGKPAEAIASYERAIAKSDREPAARAQFLIGKIQSDQNNPKDALKSFLKVVYGYSYPKWQADAANEAARCLELLDQKPQAAAMYQELIDKFPKSDKVAPAKKRLKELQDKK